MSGASDYQVTVIIPTLADSARRDCLLRAIDCILTQQDVKALPLVVINGERFDPDLRKALEERSDIKTLYLAEGHVSKARELGVENVESPFFSFLDDDDLFTKDALTHRLKCMDQSPLPDVVVTNHYMEKDGKLSLRAEDMAVFSHDPYHTIFEISWLNSLNNLFRTETVGPEYFKNMGRFMEWTALGVKLARNKRICFSNKATAIYHDSPDSASKEYAYFEGGEKFLASLSRREFPPRTRRLINRKHAATLNGLSQMALADGHRAKAWSLHMRCLAIPGGWRYLSYTRKLFWPRRSGKPVSN